MRLIRKKKFNKINSPVQREIINLLKKREACSMGQIVKSLTISYDTGLKNIEKLKKMDIVDTRSKAPNFCLKAIP